VTVAIRPEAARLDGEGSRTQGGDGLPGLPGLPGRVADVAYRGHGYDHLIELADGTRLAGVFATERRPRGETVRIGLDPAGCFAYLAGASDGVPVR
jgi:iron(III) transport system ATP-binding protein